MEPDDLLCSRNARLKKALVGRAQWKINQPPSLKRQRASLEGSFISFDTRNRGIDQATLLRASKKLLRPRWMACLSILHELTAATEMERTKKSMLGTF
jgi:hypothetical protein